MAEVASGLFVHQGRQAGLDSPQRDDVANIGFIVGGKCVAVIDTGGSPATGARLRDAVRKVTPKPLCYVINTHVHYDHLLGNAAFVNQGAPFVGHRNLVAAVENNRAFFEKSFAREFGGDSAASQIKGPDITVAKKKVLDLGGRKIELRAHKRAHSDADLTVFDRKTNTLWASDLLFVERIPAIDGSVTGWVAETEKLRSLKVSKVIPGHGAVPEDWHAALDAQLRYLKKLRDGVRKILRDGGFLEDVLDKVAYSEKDRWLLFDENHRRNITRAFAELEWESP